MSSVGSRALNVLGLVVSLLAGASAYARPGPARIEWETQHAKLALDGQGRLVELRLLASGRDVAARDPQPILELDRGGTTATPTSVRREKGTLVASFDTLSVTVRLAVDERDGALVFRVASIVPADVAALRLRFSVTNLGTQEASLNGTYDDTDVVSLRSITAGTECVFKSVAGAPSLGVAWTPTYGMVGEGAALLAAPRALFFDVVGALERAEGLPSPHYDGVPARLAASVRKSTLFLTYYRAGDLPLLLDYAKLGGFGHILVLRGLWRESSGTYGIAPATFPGGLDEFEDFCSQIHDADLGVGLHLYGPSVSPNDPLVTPVPEDGLLAWPCSPLAADLDARGTEVEVLGEPDLPAPQAGGFPGTYLRLGDEILHYTGTLPGAPFTFQGCERGALGTTATAHAAGSEVLHLAETYGLFLVDPDGPLVAKLAQNLGRVVNQADVDLVYFDGAPSAAAGDYFQAWYAMNRLLPAYNEAFDHTVLVQTSSGPGRQLDWHLVPRSASADGHGDVKAHLDQRIATIESIRRGLTVPEIGWYGFDPGRPPDYLEYVAAKCLGWGCPLSVLTNRYAMEGDSRARETMEILGRYERCKQGASLSPSACDRLLVPGVDVRLLEDDAGAWRLYEADYDREVDVRTLVDGGYALGVNNPAAAPRTLGIELVRGATIQVDADWSAPGKAYVDLFRDVTPYVPSAENDAVRLVERVDKVLTPAGAARRGVEHALNLVQDPQVGGPCAALSATNTNNVIGWCAVGRRFESLLDLSAMSALELWVHGDQSGVTVNLELWDDQDHRAVLHVPIFFEGWRLHAAPLVTPPDFDRARVRVLLLVVTNVTPRDDVEVRFAALRATPVVRPDVDLTGVSLQIGDRTIALPAALPAGGTARIDALGRLTMWPGGMGPGQSWALPGGPVVVGAGTHTLRLEVAGGAAYPGDLSIRVSRLERFHPEK